MQKCFRWIFTSLIPKLYLRCWTTPSIIHWILFTPIFVYENYCFCRNSLRRRINTLFVYAKVGIWFKLNTFCALCTTYQGGILSTIVLFTLLRKTKNAYFSTEFPVLCAFYWIYKASDQALMKHDELDASHISFDATMQPHRLHMGYL